MNWQRAASAAPACPGSAEPAGFASPDSGEKATLTARHGGNPSHRPLYSPKPSSHPKKHRILCGIEPLRRQKTDGNYLAVPPGSIFVCYHTTTSRLLVRRVDEVVRDYEHSGGDWRNQQTVTVRFRGTFDHGFQRSLKAHIVAAARKTRDERLDWAIHPPEALCARLEEGAIRVPVPADPQRAKEILVELYENGHDRTISQSFDTFRASLGFSDGTLLLLYMAEINLGINGKECSRPRIREGIEALHSAVPNEEFRPGSLLYSIGNGWLALKEYKRARDAYNSALFLLDEAPDVAAKCCKNLGTALEKLGEHDAARSLYERALALDPSLAEAHFALGLSHYRHGKADLVRSLEHLDAIVWPKGSAGTRSPVQGWRADILFKERRIEEAFREVHALLGAGPRPAWVWPWCARLVAAHGRISLEAGRRAIRFWNLYLKECGDDLRAQRELVLCVYLVYTSGGRTEWDYERFKRAVERLVADGESNPAFLWDRVGHWAQAEANWAEAEASYRRAFDLSPNEYGYCLGTALNFLARHDEAVPILLPQAREHKKDAMSWFQLGVALDGIDDVEGSIKAYRKALELDEGYDLAWFNLGGMYWNSGDKATAAATWREAMRRFPAHRLSSKLQKDLPGLMG